MATVGLRDLYCAKVNEVDGKDTYGPPKRLAKAITAELSVEIAEGTLYADDAVDATEKEFVSGELTLNINDLDPEDQAMVLGQTLDEDGVIYAGGDDTAPYLAIGFRAKKPGGKFKYIWLYKVKFAVPDESYNTKADGIEFTTPEMVGTFLTRHDGLWKADAVALPTDPIGMTWFNAVKEPSVVAPPEPEPQGDKL